MCWWCVFYAWLFIFFFHAAWLSRVRGRMERLMWPKSHGLNPPASSCWGERWWECASTPSFNILHSFIRYFPNYISLCCCLFIFAVPSPPVCQELWSQPYSLYTYSYFEFRSQTGHELTGFWQVLKMRSSCLSNSRSWGDRSGTSWVLFLIHLFRSSCDFYFLNDIVILLIDKNVYFYPTLS